METEKLKILEGAVIGGICPRGDGRARGQPPKGGGMILLLNRRKWKEKNADQMLRGLKLQKSALEGFNSYVRMIWPFSACSSPGCLFHMTKQISEKSCHVYKLFLQPEYEWFLVWCCFYTNTILLRDPSSILKHLLKCGFRTKLQHFRHVLPCGKPRGLPSSSLEVCDSVQGCLGL